MFTTFRRCTTFLPNKRLRDGLNQTPFVPSERVPPSARPDAVRFARSGGIFLFRWFRVVGQQAVIEIVQRAAAAGAAVAVEVEG